MPVFDFQFTVEAPISVVRDFHHDTSALKKLTPPPIFAQIHAFEPMAEGSLADFTLWFGPLPVRWTAVHSNVNEYGFTDTQVKGPLQRWQHSHRFTMIDAQRTRVQEHIEYEYPAGARGILARLLFNKVALFGLFTARKMLTRRGTGQMRVIPVANP